MLSIKNEVYKNCCDELRIAVEKETLDIIGQNIRAEIYGKIWLNIVPMVQINLDVNRVMSW